MLTILSCPTSSSPLASPSPFTPSLSHSTPRLPLQYTPFSLLSYPAPSPFTSPITSPPSSSQPPYNLPPPYPSSHTSLPPPAPLIQQTFGKLISNGFSYTSVLHLLKTTWRGSSNSGGKPHIPSDWHPPAIRWIYVRWENKHSSTARLPVDIRRNSSGRNIGFASWRQQQKRCLEEWLTFGGCAIFSIFVKEREKERGKKIEIGRERERVSGYHVT